MELVIDRVSKQYKNKISVDRISVKLQKGVHGLLGENGAGKTTLMRMICGILKPTSGTISFNGVDVSEESYRAVLGYLPQDFGYYPEFTGQDFLMYMAALKGIAKPQARRRTAELLQLVSLQNVAKKKIKTYSGGMKQRLGIAQALLNRPELLVLDEPTAGLDPKERVRFRNLIEELGKESIVLLSTHIVSDVEHIADTVLIMKDGQLIYRDKWDDGKGNLEDFYLRHIDVESGMENGAGIEMKNGTDTGVGNEMKNGTNTGAENEMKNGTDTEAGNEMKNGTDTGARNELESENETGKAGGRS